MGLSVKNHAFPVKDNRKFISAKCVGTMYCNVDLSTDGNINSHNKEYHRCMETCSTMQSKYIHNKYIERMSEYKYK